MSSLHRPTFQRVVRATSVTAAAVLTLSTGALVWSSTAQAAAPDIYDLSSTAIAFDSTTTDPWIPLGIPFSYGSYGASSILNSNGESSADAGAPYSPLVSSLPNTGNGVANSTFGQGLPVVPTFPGYVSAKDPITPLAKQNAGGYELVATAGPGKSSGVVNMGAQSATSEQNNAFAFATSTAGDDGVLTEGSAGMHAFSMEGILDIVNVSSYASLARDGFGKTVPVTTTNLGTISFAGLTSGVTGDGFTAFGSAPTPISTDNLAALNDALKPSGITLTYLPEIYAYTDGSTSTGPTVNPKKDVSGVMSGAPQIFITNTSDRGTSTETLTFGRVSLTATSTSLNSSASDSTTDTAAGLGTASGGTSGAALPSTGTDVTGSGVDAAGLNAGTLPGTVPGAAPQLTGATGSQLPTQSFVPASSSAAYDIGTTSFKSSFLFLAIGAAVALAGAQAVRLLAVRAR